MNLLLQISERKHRLPLLQNNVKVGNSLIDDPSVSDKAFKWEEEFPEKMKEGGFDIVIGNPPYIKEYLNKSAFEPLKKTRLAKYYQGKMDIWYLFGSLSIDLLKENGLHSFIAQNNWITSYGASKFRNKVLSETELISFFDFNNFKVFLDSEIQTMIYILKKTKPRGSYPVDSYIALGDKISETSIRECMNNQNIQCEKIEHRVLNFRPSEFIDKEISFLTSFKNSIITRIESNTNFHLKNEDVSTGIDVHQDFVVGYHLGKLKDNSIKLGDGIFVINQDEVNRLNLMNNEKEIIKPYFTSRELTNYYGNPNNNYFVIYSKSNMNKIISQYPNIKKHLDKFRDVITSDFRPYGLHRARGENFFEGEKIISLRKTREPHFTYTDFPCYVSQTFFVIKPKDVNLKVLTAILNSDVIHFWLRSRGKKQGNLLQVDKAQLLALPIKLPNNTPKGNEISQAMNESMNIIIETIKKLNKAEGEGQKELFLKRIKIEIDKLNELIYELYELDEKSIRLIRSYLSQQ